MDNELKPCGKKVPHKKHGLINSNIRLYQIWKFMKYRCDCKQRREYARYGGRGINVCDEWRDPSVFCKWALENGYRDDLQIDRIDNDGNYCPENCRWVTFTENSRNKGNTVFLTIDGQTRSAPEWSELLSINVVTLRWWINTYGSINAINRIRRTIADGTK